MFEPLRIAILPIDLSYFEDAEITEVQGHFKDGIWTEPERRYAVEEFLKRCDLPDSWQIAQRGMLSAIWIDYTRAQLCIAFESDDFPLVEIGQTPPTIDVTLQRDEDGRVSLQGYWLRSYR